MPIAEPKNVTMRYDQVAALQNVSFALEAGETVTLLGPNGAGKSTTIALLTGLRRAQSGSVTLFGGSPVSPRYRRRIGVAPQETAFPAGLRVGEALDFARSHFSPPVAREEIIDAFGLGRSLAAMAAELSGGQQRKLAVALAFCGKPNVAFLDEPTTGLDLAARDLVWGFLRRFKLAGGTVLLTTHNLAEVEALSDRVIVLREGTIIRDVSLAEMKSAVAAKVIRLDASPAPQLRSARLQSSNGSRHVFVCDDADVVVRELIESDVAFANIEIEPASLEQAIGQCARALT